MRQNQSWIVFKRYDCEYWAGAVLCESITQAYYWKYCNFCRSFQYEMFRQGQENQ